MHTRLTAGPIGIYARFSSDRQREASIEDQVRRCRDFIAKAGRDPEEAIIFSDYATSGAGLDRPGFEAMMQAIEEQRIKTVITEDLSRISRDFADSALIFKKLQFAQVPLIGVADGIDTSAKHAKLSYTVKSLLADMYLDELRDKTLRGLEGRALAGYATGSTPFGYRTTAETDQAGRTIGHRIEIDEEQATILHRIFGAYVQGDSLAAIAKQLNRDGIPSPRAGTRHKRKGWGPSTIRAILYNERYAGVWKYKETQWVKVPGTNRRVPRQRDPSEVMQFDRPELRIIDEALWTRTHKRLAAMKRKYTRKGKETKERVIAGGKSDYLLSGIVVCGHCNGTMAIHGGTHAKYYRCAANKSRGTCDNSASIREDVVRPRLLEAIRSELSNPEGIAYLRKRIAEELGEMSRRLEAELRDRRSRLTRTEQNIHGLIGFIAQGERSDYITTTLRDLEAHAKAEKSAIERLEHEAQAPIRLPSLDDISRLVLDLDDRLMQDPVAGRNRLRTWLKDEVIRLTPQPNGAWLAEGAIYPLVILNDSGTPSGPGPTPSGKAFPKSRKDHTCSSKYANQHGLTFVAGTNFGRRTTCFYWIFRVPGSSAVARYASILVRVHQDATTPAPYNPPPYRYRVTSTADLPLPCGEDGRSPC